jgi:hypothetical protein
MGCRVIDKYEEPRVESGRLGRVNSRRGVNWMQGSAKVFEFQARWDAEAGVWWCSNAELPVTTEAPTFDQLVNRVLEIAPEIAELNGIASRGEEIAIRVIGERSQSVTVSAAA